MRGAHLIPLVLLFAIASASVASGMVTYELPSEFTIIEPRYSVPATVMPGGTFNITLSTTGSLTITSVTLVGLNVTKEISLGSASVGPGESSIEVSLPSDILPGLYDLIITTSSGVHKEPRAVWVLGEDYDSLKIFLAGDSILGGSAIGGKYTWQMYEAAVLYANALQPDLFVMVGDDVDVGNDVNSLKQFAYITNELMVPSFVIPGNHDWAQVSSSTDFYSKYYGLWVGPGDWVREVGDFVFIGLDAGFENYLRQDQLDWLESIVQSYEGSGKTVVIVIHPPFVMQSGDYVASPEEFISKYPDAVHKSWASHEDSYVRFLRILNDYDCIKFVLSGDTHRDEVATYNGKVTLITVTAIGHPNVYRYRGFRMIQLFANGSVKFFTPPGRDPRGPEASYNSDHLYVNVAFNRDYSFYGYYIKIDPGFGLNLTNAPIYFFLNATYPLSQYSVYGDTDRVHSVEKYIRGDKVIIKAYVDLIEGTENTFVAATGEDTSPPEVSISSWTPRKPMAGRQPITVMISAADEGWGIKLVKLLYKTPDMSDWEEVGAVYSSGTYYRANVPVLNTPYVLMKAVAIDWAGHETESDTVNVTYMGYQTTTTTSTTTTTTASTTTTTTTTTTTSKTTTTTTITTTTTTTTTTTSPSAPPEGALTPTQMGVVIAVAVIVIIIAIVLMKKR